MYCRISLLLLVSVGSGCGTTRQTSPSGATTNEPTTHGASEAAAPSNEEAATPEAAPVEPASTGPSAACDATIPVFAEGHETERVCAAEAERRGLTVLDLSNDFAPQIFDEAPELGELGTPPYRANYVALADERWEALPEDIDPEHYLELFGIFATPRVLQARLVDAERHACHAAIDDAALEAYEGTMRTWTSPAAEQRARKRQVEFAARAFEAERVRLGVESVEALQGRTSRPSTLTTYLRDRVTVQAVIAMQDHLLCDGLLDARRYERGIYDSRTATALAAFQRQHVVVSAGTFDPPSRVALAQESHEGDFRAVLRTLRERVVDATGVIEDGSAQHVWGTVFGREVDPIEMRTVVGAAAPAHAAADWVSPATEAAASALGWTSPEGFLAFDAQPAIPTHVAVQLPVIPAYYSNHMELRAEIDRGDVWFDYPYTSEGRRRSQPVRLRPTLTLYAQTPDGEVALVQWPTTIGGWKPERSRSGGLGLRYKESPAGPRIWRDVIAAPAWLPPPSTPDDELVRRVPGGNYVPNTSLFGPGYRSAYGLAMVMNHRVYEPRREGDAPTIADEGVRAHGSVGYGSILRGQSHGCHRLYNHLAVRLTGFLVRHRHHVRHGSIAVRYARQARAGGRVVTFRIASRGYRYELTPPVPVNVLVGNVLGDTPEAIDGLRPLPRRAQADAQATAAADE
jgi:hypothetical protein